MADANAAALDGEPEVEEGAEGEQPKSKFKLKLPPMKFLIIGAAALVLIGGGVGAYFFFFSGADRGPIPRSRFDRFCDRVRLRRRGRSNFATRRASVCIGTLKR